MDTPGRSNTQLGICGGKRLASGKRLVGGEQPRLLRQDPLPWSVLQGLRWPSNAATGAREEARVSILNETYTLADGTVIPKMGLGTWLMDDTEAAQAVRDAVAAGYRMVDTAQAYGNEASVGEGVRSCGAAPSASRTTATPASSPSSAAGSRG